MVPLDFRLPALLDESWHASVEQAIGLPIEKIADCLAEGVREEPLGREAEARELVVEL
jgi:hypothetical protein